MEVFHQNNWFHNFGFLGDVGQWPPWFYSQPKSKEEKKFVPKCVMTPEDHFERHFFFPEFKGGGAKESVEKPTLFISFF